MICEPAHQSSSDLASALQISAGSVSTQARLLETVGFLERITFPGDRSTYYQLKPNVWRELMWSEQQRIEEMRSLAEAAEPLTPDTRPDRVEELDLISSFFLDRWPDLMAELGDHLEKERRT